MFCPKFCNALGLAEIQPLRLGLPSQSFHSVSRIAPYGPLKRRRRVSSTTQQTTLSKTIPSHSRSRLRRRAVPFVSGVLVCAICIPLSLYAYYQSHFEEVPITNRRRMLWYNQDYDEEIGFPVEEWLLTQKDKPMLGPNDPITQMVQSIVNRLLTVEAAQNCAVKAYVYDSFQNPNAHAGPGKNGGRVFINTGMLLLCYEDVNDIAGVLAHELGHVVARHSIERKTAKLFATEVAKWFGFKGSLGTDLHLLRIQEEEADRMGLMIMAQAGFDPEVRVNHFKQARAKELTTLNGREPQPEFLCTHPSAANRWKMAEYYLLDAKVIYDQVPDKYQHDTKDWAEFQATLLDNYREFVAKCQAAQDKTPDALLRRIENKVLSLEKTLLLVMEANKQSMTAGAEEVVPGEVIRAPIMSEEEDESGLKSSLDYLTRRVEELRKVAASN